MTLFRRGDIPLEVRDRGAGGELASDDTSQLGLLLFLLDDPDTGVATRAQASLDSIPDAALEAFLARADVPPELREAFAARGVVPGPVPAPDDAPPLVSVGDTGTQPDDEAEPEPQMLAMLPVIDKIKLAFKGSAEQRKVLIRDPNKVVAVSVMGSPKLNPTEVEAFAKMTNVQEEVLRIIGSSRHWVKYYPVAASLVSNPKTPIGIAMGLVTRLNERDLKVVALDRNVPDGVRKSARRFVQTGQARRR